MDVDELHFVVSGTRVRFGTGELADSPFLENHRVAFIDGEWRRVAGVEPGSVRVLHLTIGRGPKRSAPRPILDVLCWDRRSRRAVKLFHRVLFDDGDYFFDEQGRLLLLDEEGRMRRVG